MKITKKAALCQLKNVKLIQDLFSIKPSVMTRIITTIENNELETELQELFLIAKEWISELAFIQCELEVLNKLFKKASFIISKGDFDKLSSLDKIHTGLKKRIKSYIQTLESLILNPKQRIDSSLVETQVQLAYELEQILQRLQNFKKNIFKFNKHYVKPSVSTPAAGYSALETYPRPQKQ